jgi:hypothetical protein
MTEAEFYQFFGSFEAVEQSIWNGFAIKTIGEIRSQEVWAQYSAREKALSFFYGFFELLKGSRSFAFILSKNSQKALQRPGFLNP